VAECGAVAPNLFKGSLKIGGCPLPAAGVATDGCRSEIGGEMSFIFAHKTGS
jgi:hypothetical protein